MRLARATIGPLALAAAVGLLGTASAHAARIASVVPSGEVAEVRQVVVRFDADVVPLGDPRLPAPLQLRCNGNRTPPGDGRWDNARMWIYELREPLAAGERCTLSPAPGSPVTLDAGPRSFTFATGAPVVLRIEPWPGSRIEEDAHFLLQTNGAVSPASVPKAAWCEAEGVAERIGVRVVDGAAREAVLRQRRIGAAAAERALLLACERRFAPEARVRLVWGPGIVAAANPDLVSRRSQRWEWTVRPRFLAEFSCERENANAPCMPLRPLWLRFNAPVPRDQALAVRLVPEAAAPGRPNVGSPPAQPIAPSGGADGDHAPFLHAVRFAAPLPEHTRWRIVLPPGLVDDSGRTLANAGSFPLTVATGGLPPLAKFAGAPFGIVEAGPEAMMPLTLRQVQADIAGASTGGAVRSRRLDAGTPDAELLQWLVRLRKDHDDQFRTRAQSLLAGDPAAVRTALPQLVAPPAAASRPGAAPASAAAATPLPAPTEVIGIPLPQRGYHVLEVESRILGHALLATRAPMYARTGALVTNLAVHFKRGRSSSLAWVTTLDRGRPVRGARVAVSDCRGRQLWSGETDAHGIARIERGFDADGTAVGTAGGSGAGAVRADTDGGAARAAAECPGHDGLFVTARHAGDLSFVFGNWNRGIEPWRFNIPMAWDAGLDADRRGHTVFDRTLLRAGETVSMKHFVRLETARGLALPAPDALPNAVLLRHVGSEAETRLPLAWPRGARSAESRWAIPKNAPLGLYDVTLVSGGDGTSRPETRLASGSFRVEAFRVPLVDARLAGPPGPLVAPSEVAFAAQLNALAGGPMPDTPVALSALLRRAPAGFAGWDDFSFEPPRSAETAPGRDAEDDEERRDDGARLVADKLAARTDAQGAARLVTPKLPAIVAPSELQAELTFQDPNGETQTVSRRLPLWPAAVVVGIRAPGWAALKPSDGQGSEVGVGAVVLSTDGKPLANQTVVVTGRLQRTLTTRKRIVGGFYAYDNQRTSTEIGTLCEGRTDARGRFQCTARLPAQRGGEIVLVASARDDAGRTSRAATSVWAASGDEWWFEQDNDDRIDLLPETRELMPGQTARLQVRMPYRQATALVTVEREGVIDSRVVTLTGREPVIEVPIPARSGKAGADGAATWAPNVVVSVLVQRGRLRQAPWWSLFTWGWREPGEWWRAFRYEGRDWRAPTALVDLAKPSFKLGVAQLSVGLADHRLDVAVKADKAQYAVRETARVTVQVSHGGKPAAGAEVAFAAVDEGLLALMPNTSWALLEGLMQPRPWAVHTATALNEVVGRRHYGRKTLPPGGGGGRNPTRELFDTLLLWRGQVALDALGRATIDVPLNDALTSFRLVAIADAGADRFGTGSTVIRTSQDLQMLAGLPPLAREGDRYDAGFTLRNTTTRPMAVTARLEGRALLADGSSRAVDGLAPQTAQLAAGAATELRWSVQVPAGAVRIDWEGAVQESAAPRGSAAAADRIKVAQAVQPAVPARVWQATLQQLDPAAPWSLNLAPPADAVPGSARVVASLQPRLSAGLPGVRRFFETYPYTCLEQKASRAVGLRDAAAWAVLRDEVAGYLDADGLAAYFPPSPGSPAQGSDRLTAYLLSMAHEAGWSWPEPARDAMLRGLAAFVEGRLERRFPSPRADLDVRKLAALDALSRHGRVEPRQLGSIAWVPAAWPTSALLDAWGLYRRSAALPDRAARLDELQRLVRSRLALGGTALRFSTEETDHWWWLMDGPDANAVRLLLLATPEPAWRDELPLILSGTLARQRGGAWLTTTANLWGTLALERFGAAFEAAEVAGRSRVQVGGVTREHAWRAGDAGARPASAPVAGAPAAPPAASGPVAASAAATAAGALSGGAAPRPAGIVTLDALPLAQAATLQALHDGSGKPWLTLQSLAAVPLRAPLAAGLRLSRSVTAVQRRDPQAWHRGDIVRVRIEFDAAADLGWVAVSDPLPAGATVLGSGLARDSAIATRGEQTEGRAWPAYQERAADAFRSYYAWVPRGRHAVEYTLRLNTAGRFGLPPTRAEAMYAPETFGELPNAAVEVRP
jgi:uncharacterized protein YfaS (alpha-2-macroglobulin family)